MCSVWVSAVRTEITSRSAICLLVRPSAMRSAISRSRRVSAFGDSAAFRRTISYDSQLKRAVDLLRNAGTQRELLAAVTQTRPRSD